MDINFTKHNIVTEETLVSTSVEIPVESNIVIYGESDMKRLIKSCFHAAITSKSINERSVTIEGMVTVGLIYIDEDNCLCNHEHTIPFSKTVETEYELGGAVVVAEITDRRLSAHCTSENKVAVSGAISISLKVTKDTEQEIICDIDNRDIEQLCEKTGLTMPMGYGEKNLICEEEISVGNGQPSVKCLIRHNATASVEETKIINNKVMVKGTVKVYVLYMSDEGTRPQSFEESFPFSQLVEVNGINEDCKCFSTAEIIFCELKPHSAEEEIRSFNVSLKLCVRVKGYCDDEIPVLLDAYSTKQACSAVHNNFTFKKITENVNDRFVAKKTLEFTDGAIGSIIDVWCESKTNSSRFENGKLIISGVMQVNILAYDCDGVPSCYERPIEFEYAYRPEGELKNPQAEYCINVIHCSYTILGANTMSVALEILVCATVYDNIKHRLLTDICEAEDGGAESDRSSSIVLYFADEGERVWDIARRYNSSVKEIKQLNGIENDIIRMPSKVVIPTK